MTDSPLIGKTLGLIGCGNMATAIVGGILARGLTEPGRIVGADAFPAAVDRLADTHGIRVAASNTEAVQASDALLLAVKPQNAAAVMEEIAPHLTAGHLVISILAGTTTAFLEGHTGEPVPVVRVMPNTPALIGCGAAALAPGAHATDEHLTLARALFDAVGVTALVQESDLDAVTGLSGSGPAYVFAFLEAFIAAGVAAGLSPEVAETLARQTLLGAARLVHEDTDGRSPAALREAVTSPGGTTAAGLAQMADEDFAGVIERAVRAATERSRELGKA